MEPTLLFDPPHLARAIRGIAHDAHSTLQQSPSRADLRKLSRRIDRVASALGDRRHGPLGTWLDSLGREVRTAAVQRAGARCCVCVRA
jgi:hypothetical protein